jgi:hypothetical protein
MDLNPNNFISISDVLADALVVLDDQDNSKLTPGYYRAAVKNCINELGFDIPFLDVVNDYEMPVDLKLDVPGGCYNMKSIILYTGTPDAVSYQETCYWKKNMQTRGKGTGITADVPLYNTSDPFFRVDLWNDTLYYFNVQNGTIMLSDACVNFDYVRLKYSGIPASNLDEMRMIPPEAREAVLLYVIEKCASSLKLKDNKYRAVQIDAAAQLDRYGMNGAWHNTITRLAKLDYKKYRDTILYNSNLLTH